MSETSQSKMGHLIELAKWALQGRWFGHPLHPLLTHLPTSLWPAALVLDCISFIKGGDHPSLTLTAWWCILAGLASAMVAVPTGLADWSDIKPQKPARKIGLIHMGINAVVFCIFVANFVLRCLAGPSEPRATFVQLILSAVGVGMLLVSGYLGGLMIYDHGIRVAQLAGAHTPPK
jgi:uncharacterized membrane protein